MRLKKYSADNTALFEKIPVLQAVRTMALPTIFSQIIILIYNMADTFYLGRTGDPYMVAGVSLILPVFNICLSVAGLTGMGGGALISRLLGAGKDDEARKVSAFSLRLTIVVSAAFAFIMLAFMPQILRFLGASGNTFRFARQYTLCVVVAGSIPTVLSNVMSNLLRSIGESEKAGFGIAMGGIINIFLDPLFMFVLLPPGHEVLGVGIATLLSNCIACSYFIFQIHKIKDSSVLTFAMKHGLPSRTSIISVFNVGIPSAVVTLLFDIDYVVIGRLMSGWSDIALAAVGIVLKVERLPLNIGIGLCQGMMPLVAYNYSSGDHARMRRIIRFTLLTGILVGAVSVTLYEIFAGNIMHFFIAESETVRLGTNFLRIRTLATPFMFMSFFLVYVFQGFGEGRIALMLGLVRWAVLNIPMLFILNYLIGMYGIVCSQVTADILTVIFSYVVYWRYVKRHFYSFST